MPVLSPSEVARRVELVERGLSDRDAADAVGISMTAFRQWRYNNGIVKLRPASTDKRGLYDEGLSDQQIARRLGITTQAVGAWRRNNNLAPNGGVK